MRLILGILTGLGTLFVLAAILMIERRYRAVRKSIDRVLDPSGRDPVQAVALQAAIYEDNAPRRHASPEVRKRRKRERAARKMTRSRR